VEFEMFPSLNIGHSLRGFCVTCVCVHEPVMLAVVLYTYATVWNIKLSTLILRVWE